MSILPFLCAIVTAAISCIYPTLKKYFILMIILKITENHISMLIFYNGQQYNLQRIFAYILV